MLWATVTALLLHGENPLWIAAVAGAAGAVSGMYFANWCNRRTQADRDERLLSQIIEELEAR